ncbi:MAG: aromatic amino acid ammonia-lyase [Pseudomonadota bacterium]
MTIPAPSVDRSRDCPTVCLGPDQQLAIADLEAIAQGAMRVEISTAAKKATSASAGFLDALIAEERCIYGVTTGYGPLANNHVDPRCSDALQRNLVYHLASGVGAPLCWASARAVVTCRLQALSQGLSAVSHSVLDLLALSLNTGLAPVIPEKGTVGASGDLTPLSHMALALMGEGAWMDAKGLVSNAAAFARMDTQPLALGPKEGLALVNGTSAMTGIAGLNGAKMRRLLKQACLLSLMNAEVFQGHLSAWHPLVGAARGQPGQQAIHALLWLLTGQGSRMQPFEATPAKLQGSGDVRHDQLLPQDPYSIRCVPQLLGACLDMLETHDDVVGREMSAVTDNPLVFPQQSTLIHAGNFFGQHVAFAADALSNAAIMVAILLERQIARVTDVQQSAGLPAFLQGRQTGLNSGFMGAQVTATALVAEMRARGVPASIQSIPTNANNQDVVTMGTIAARSASAILADAGRIAAIHAMCMAQAVDLREAQSDKAGFSQVSLAMRDFVRTHTAFLGEDRPLSNEIETLADAMALPGVFADIFADIAFAKDALAQF